jgi:hypothetical protein
MKCGGYNLLQVLFMGLITFKMNQVKSSHLIATKEHEWEFIDLCYSMLHYTDNSIVPYRDMCDVLGVKGDHKSCFGGEKGS